MKRRSDTVAPKKLGEPAGGVQAIFVGALSFLTDENGIRRLKWNGVEVVRGLFAQIRDANWGTLPLQHINETIEEDEGHWRLTRRAECMDGAMRFETVITVGRNGTVSAAFQVRAERDLRINRAGFTVLHPIAAVAGQDMEVRHTDGRTETLTFPLDIAPEQPVLDIAAISHQVRGVRVTLEFDGETFEMEDQRNWSDASFKTYCRPLALPFPFEVRAGETLKQGITIHMSGNARGAESTTAPLPVPVAGRVPDILLAAQGGWESANPPAVQGVLLRVNGGTSLAMLTGLALRLRESNAYLDAEIIVASGCDPQRELNGAARRLTEAGILPRHVIALPDAYLKSYQPSGPWPDGPTPRDCAHAAAGAFPSAEIGVGMLTNFTELNRCRPDPPPAPGSYITHANSAIVHAADDLSVFETLEALPQIFASGHKIASGRAYRLGLMAIGMRTNPYGEGLTRNPGRQKITMTGTDPRQNGLFGAAYAIGAASAAALSGIEAIALGAISGPFGLEGDDGKKWPIFHAVQALAQAAGRAAMPLPGMPEGLAGLVFDGGLIAANCSLSPITFASCPEGAAILDAGQLTAAGEAGWLANAAHTPGGPVTLGPCACVFALSQGAS